MKNSEATYESLISMENLKGLKSREALKHIGSLIDLSFYQKKTEGLEHALKLSEELCKRQLTAEQSATLHYFQANAWSDLKKLLREGTHMAWEWEQQEIENEIFHYRSALQSEGFQVLPKGRQCQILTNLGNSLSHIGRFVEAIEYWNRALDVEPSFAMARGNRGHGLTTYANSLYDDGHRAVFLKFALADLKDALSIELHKNAYKSFNKLRKWIESVLSEKFIKKELDMNSFSLGTPEEEIQYRQWCLENRLFLNPLNDLGSYPIAARDILTTPSIVLDIGEGPYYQGFYNQMKQEYVSVRYLYYEGINVKQPHFSDKDVLLYNTLDYPSYSLAVEKMKAAFRLAYSIFDKIAYFLKEYLGLSIVKVYFRTFWYKSQKRNKGLKECFEKRKNWPLRGLFWLSKDLFEDKPGFKDSIEPDAQELYEIRNHLEHKYFKLHNDDWIGQISNNNKSTLALTDTLAFSLYRRDFEAKTLRLIKIVRAALIYLSLAIHCEEKQREERREPKSIIPKTPLDVWEDEWKV